MMNLLVPPDGGPIGNTHSVGFGGLLAALAGVWLPILVAHAGASPDIVDAARTTGGVITSLGVGGTYFGRPINVK